MQLPSELEGERERGDEREGGKWGIEGTRRSQKRYYTTLIPGP